MKKTSLLVSLLLPLLALGCAGRDVDKVCPIVNEVLKDPSLKGADRDRVLYERLLKSTSSSPMKKTLEAITMARPQDRYAMFKSGASEMGRPNFECAALEKMWTPKPALSGTISVPEGTPIEGSILELSLFSLKGEKAKLASTQIKMSQARVPFVFDPELPLEPQMRFYVALKKSPSASLATWEKEHIVKYQEAGLELSLEEIVAERLNKAMIKKVVDDANKRVRYCYEKQLARKPKLKGRLEIKWVIAQSGKVVSAKVAKDTAKDEILAACMVKLVRSLEFPKVKDTKPKSVTYPFVFSAN